MQDLKDHLRANEIVRQVCRLRRIRVSELFSRRRSARITQARQLAAYLIRRHLGWNHHRVARFFGFKAHSSAVYCFQSVAFERTYNHTLNKQIEQFN